MNNFFLTRENLKSLTASNMSRRSSQIGSQYMRTKISRNTITIDNSAKDYLTTFLNIPKETLDSLCINFKCFLIKLAAASRPLTALNRKTKSKMG